MGLGPEIYPLSMGSFTDILVVVAAGSAAVGYGEQFVTQFSGMMNDDGTQFSGTWITGYLLDSVIGTFSGNR